jgi:hypothetical protein
VIAVILADASPTPKDAVVAIMGASPVLAGLVLVFLGIAISGLQKALTPIEESASGWKKFWSGLANWALASAWLAVYLLAAAIFALSMASIGLSLAWLTIPAGRVVYDVDIWLFAGELLAIAMLGALVLLLFYSDAKSRAA